MKKSFMLIGLTQQTDRLLFAGMAGGKCVTMACNYRNTFGFSLWNDCHWQSSYFDSLRDAPHTVSLPRANCCLTHKNCRVGACPHRSLSTIDRRVFAEIFSHVNNGSAYSSIGCGRGMPRPYNGVSFKQQFIAFLAEPDQRFPKKRQPLLIPGVPDGTPGFAAAAANQ